MRYLTIFLLVILASCGTRKRDAYVSTVKKDVVLLTQNDITTNTNIKKTSTTTTYTPIDPTKPMVTPDGRTSTNAKIEEKEVVNENLTTKIDKSKTEKSETTKEKTKDVKVETEKPNPWFSIGLWVAVAVVLCFALYFANRWFGVFTKK